MFEQHCNAKYCGEVFRCYRDYQQIQDKEEGCLEIKDFFDLYVFSDDENTVTLTAEAQQTCRNCLEIKHFESVPPVFGDELFSLLFPIVEEFIASYSGK